MITAALAASVGLFGVLRPIAGRRTAAGVAAPLGLLVAAPCPLSIVVIVAGAGAAALSRLKKTRPQPPTLTAALMVGAAAGLSLQAALKEARPGLDGSDATELDGVLRDARRRGLAVALQSATGDLAPLLRRLARAQVSGAPLITSIEAYAAEERRIRKAEAVERARKLPVKLTVPLALLILPGFLLLTAAPAAVGFLTRMLGPLLP